MILSLCPYPYKTCTNSNTFCSHYSLTSIFVEDKFQLELGLVLEGLFDGDLMVLRGVRAVQELAGAALLHDLRALVARQLAEAVLAVHDGV